MTKKLIIGIIILSISAIGFMLSSYVVEENEYACVLRFEKIVKTKTESGLYFKVPFTDTVTIYPKMVMLYDINPSDVITKDKKTMIVDSYVLWKINDPVMFKITIGNTKEAEARLDALAYNFTKTKMGTLNQDEIINMEDPDERNTIYGEILKNVRKGASNYGIEVIDVKIKRFDLPEQNEEAVYTRMISERNKMAQKYIADGHLSASLITNEVDKTYNTQISNARVQAEIIIAEGEAEYMKNIAEAYNTSEKLEFYQFIRSLDALKLSLSGDNKTIILDKDSPLAKILLNK